MFKLEILSYAETMRQPMKPVYGCLFLDRKFSLSGFMEHFVEILH